MSKSNWKHRIKILERRRDFLRIKIKEGKLNGMSGGPVTLWMAEHEALESALILMQLEYEKNVKDEMGRWGKGKRSLNR